MPFKAAHVFSSERLLNSYLDGDYPCAKKIYDTLFLHLREIKSSLPDYVHKGLMDSMQLNKNSVGKLLLSCFDLLCQPLEFRGFELRVKIDHFENWQNTLSLMTPLPLIASKVWKEKTDVQCRIKTLQAILDKSTLPSFFHPEIEDMISNGGIRELHLHINGTSEVDVVWEYALENPLKILKYIKKSFKNQDVLEQYEQLNNRLHPKKLYRILRIASSLRSILCEDAVSGNFITYSMLSFLVNRYPEEGVSRQHPEMRYTHQKNQLLNEAFFMCRCLSRIEYCNTFGNDSFAAAFHLYLLIKNHVNRLLVQQENQCGFDQFQKITKNELREFPEEHYQRRFEQLEGMYGEDLTYLEARIAPKTSAVRMVHLIKTIIKDYKKYKGNDLPTNNQSIICRQKEQNMAKRMELGLVVHFIKIHDKNPNDYHPCRHYNLRITLKKQAQILLHLKNRIPDIDNYMRGIDAASNELHASPEVFAPIFRYLQKSKENPWCQNITYHAGEDFLHLLSGIRTVYEAVEYLNLQPGNRIGHATALGILPQLWQERAGQVAYISKGEWLDNMIFSYNILSSIEEIADDIRRCEAEMLRFGEEIFGNGHNWRSHNYLELWRNRWQDPLESNFPMDGSKSCKELLKCYHSPDVYKESRKNIIVKTDFFSSKTYTLLQSKVIELLNTRQIVIESLLTSNLRISYYQSYKEHHIFRWLGLQVAEEDRLPKPTIVISSDDPGIFSTNLRNEYAHIFRVAITEKKVSPQEAANLIRQLNHNSRVYSFQEKNKRVIDAYRSR